MRVSYQQLTPYPGYEEHVAATLLTDESSQVDPEFFPKAIRPYQLAEGMTQNDIQVPGPHPGQSIRLRVFKPVNCGENAPIIFDIHGGGFTSGALDTDNRRCVALSQLSGCIAVSVEYRLVSDEVRFPEPLLDCHAAYLWLTENAGELGGDGARIGVHGTSAGGCLSAGLALYLRDRGEQTPALTVLSCPRLDIGPTPSKLRFGPLSASRNPYPNIGYVRYSGLDGGNLPPYYAIPGQCTDLRGLGPHMMITAEYDPLRDEGLRYAMRLLETGVPCEILSAPRVTHGFCAINHPLTDWVHKGIAASFRREFHMDVTEI